MARRTRLRLVSPTPTRATLDPDLPSHTYHELADVIWDLTAVKQHRARKSWREKDTNLLYRTVERLMVLAHRMRGIDFYARSTD